MTKRTPRWSLWVMTAKGGCVPGKGGAGGGGAPPDDMAGVYCAASRYFMPSVRARDWMEEGARTGGVWVEMSGSYGKIMDGDFSPTQEASAGAGGGKKVDREWTARTSAGVGAGSRAALSMPAPAR